MSPCGDAPTELVRQPPVDVESPLEIGLVRLCRGRRFHGECDRTADISAA